MGRGRSDVGSPLSRPYSCSSPGKPGGQGEQEGARCGCRQVGSRNSCSKVTNEAVTVERSAEHSSLD